MMISSELEIVLLVAALYASTCVVFAFADEGVLQRGPRGMRLRLAEDRLRLAGRSPLWLNPLLPMRPAFRGQWGEVEAITAAPGLAARVPEITAASALLAPYVLAVFLCTIVALPVSLLLAGAGGSLPVVALAYATVIALMVRLWFLRGSFLLDGRRFMLVVFESLACPPFAAGLVRRLSLVAPVPDDLASFVVDMPDDGRRQAVETLTRRCTEMASFLAENRRACARLGRYRATLEGLAGDFPGGLPVAAVAERT